MLWEDKQESELPHEIKQIEGEEDAEIVRDFQQETPPLIPAKLKFNLTSPTLQGSTLSS